MISSSATISSPTLESKNCEFPKVAPAPPEAPPGPDPPPWVELALLLAGPVMRGPNGDDVTPAAATTLARVELVGVP